MKKLSYRNYTLLVLSILLISVILTDCKKTDTPINFPLGTFPDTIINLTNINSEYDDYNIGLYQLTGVAPIVFSSNRRSSGGQFDLEQAVIYFVFDQTTGYFEFEAEMINDQFLSDLISDAETPRNDLGPYRMYSSADGYEYLILSSENEAGELDLFYLKNLPQFDYVPNIEGPFPINLLNSDYNDAYLCFDSNQDSAYFVSDSEGDFDIYVNTKPSGMEIHTWFDQEYAASTRVDSINSTGDDKCPLIFGNVMLFASDRAGGLGGFDLYYSFFKNGKWNSPVNFGPGINTSSDEYRPVIGYHPDFTNFFMMFSSNRPGGRGGFDLYFTGIEFPEK
jgi:hypothetical protein